jgi:major vault protein
VNDEFGQVKLRIGREEIRKSEDYPDPFPLHPGEDLIVKKKCDIIQANCAYLLRAIRDFYDENKKIQRHAADEWLFKGPGTYIPKIEEELVKEIKAFVIQQNWALRLR